MSARQNILERIRSSGLPSKVKPVVPDFARLSSSEFVPQFRRGLEAMAGVLVDSRPLDLGGYLKKTFPKAKNFCSAVPEFVGNSTPENYSNWADAAKIDVTIVRSPMGIAETGSVLLSETDLRVNTIGSLAHDLVVLLDPTDIVENVHVAYRHPAFRETAYCVLMTGPSGSADIDGRVVHPAQGVMTLTVILWPRAYAESDLYKVTKRLKRPVSYSWPTACMICPISIALLAGISWRDITS
jgi:L-lactate dehydrogenase complex protein LldG